MKRTLATVCCVALCSTLALAKGKTASNPAADEQSFVDFAAQTDMVEANLGQVAETVASSQQVKDYGRTLVADHTKDLHHLQEVARQINLKVPYAIDAAHNRSTIGPFHRLKGAAFDRRFIPAMITGHTEAIATYKKEAADAKDEALKSYAQDALPVLEKHLDAAKDLQHGKTAKKKS